MNWCFIIPVIVGVLCALLGYLLGRLLSGSTTNDTTELDALKKKYATLETDFNACKSKRASLETDLSKCNSDLAQCRLDVSAKPDVSNISSINTPVEPPVTPEVAIVALPFDADAAKTVFGKKIKQDDLKIIEGIGPKIEELFHNHDVKTWKALSECTIEKCQEVLNSGGKRYEIHKPGTWPRQAKMAYEGKWAALLKWQDELDGGKE
ncbi:hypothetical protein GCM10022393_04850 [Aquimarina addita]|uniref:Flap endonuclease-1-like 5' DNA nuclease n=1 Tax=Aquimarina addita TaxID=870485 RepID=A0ABP7XB22_9FLAO